MSRTRKRHSPSVPTLVTLAEWVDAELCPTETLEESGRLYFELTMVAPLRPKFGTDVRRGEADKYKLALHKIEVKADGIWFRWRYNRKYTEDWDRSKPWRGIYDLWNSIPLAERQLFDIDIPDDREKPRPDPHGNKYEERRGDELIDLWYATPAAYRPQHFFLDPVVLAWAKSRSGNPVPSVSLEDYMPDFQRYLEDLRLVVEKDAKERNGQDVHTVLDRALAALEEQRELPPQEKIDLIVRLLRASDCQHRGACQKPSRALIEWMIKHLGRLPDLPHGRVQLALRNAGARGKYPVELTRMYHALRRQAG